MIASMGAYGSLAAAGAEDKLKELQDLATRGTWSWKLGALSSGVLISLCSIASAMGHLLAPFSLILDVYMLLFGLVFIVLEYKDSLLPKRYVDSLRSNALFLTRPYGRAAFYFFVGNLQLCTSSFASLAFIVGAWTSIVGAAIFTAARSAAVQASTLKAAAFDEATLRRKFEAADVDKNGTLDTAELASLCADLGCNLTRNELEAALVVLDRDGDGSISFEEFVTWYRGNDADDF